jgi:tetratricopeptide (TPR) repeat protein
MRLHALRGDRAAALAAFTRLEATLKRDLGTRPETSTQVLAKQVGGGAGITAEVASPRPPVILRPPRLIGRDREWHVLEQAWSEGRPAIVLGEPGIGKSRVLADFAAVHSDVVCSAARAGDGAIAYVVLGRVLRALVARYDAPATAWARCELARLAPELGPPAGGALDSVRLVQAMAHLVEHARGAGLFGLVLDDLHYADEASLEALVVLFAHEGGRKVRFVAGARADEEPRVLREWRSSAAPVAISLQTLDRDGIAALLASLALPGFDVPGWVEPLFRHTGGNPLFVLETLRSVLLTPAPTPAAALPASAQLGAMIGQRLARLSAAALELAQVAAFAGQDFSAELAASVLHKHALDIADAWQELETAQILREGAFAHDLILDATVRQVAAPKALQLRQSIGAFLETHSAPPARVAEHWFLAGEWQRAARQFDAAARVQFNASRYLDAGELWRRASECFERVGAQSERHAVLQELAGCQIKAFDLSGARAVAQQLQTIAANDEQRGWALDRLVDVLNMGREDDRTAHAAAREMQQLGHATGKPWMVFNATRKLAVALAHQAQYEAALALFDTQHDWVRANPHEWNVQVWLCDYGFVLDLADRRADAVAAYLRAEMLARQHENWAVAYAALRNLALTHLWAGRLETALRTSDQAVGFSARLGDALVERNPRDAARRGALLRDAGRFSQALDLLRTAHATLSRGGSPYWLAYCEDQLATLYALVGQPARARDLLLQDRAELPAEARLSRWIMRSRLARAQSLAPVPWTQEHAATSADPACPARWRLLASIEHARSLELAPALHACDAIAEEAEQRALGGLQLAALALAAGRATSAEKIDVASAFAQRAHALAESTWPAGMSWPELCLCVHRGLLAAGDSTAAATAVERALRWIEAEALPNVPAEFKDSFLNRNPAHRAILTGIARGARH